MVGSFLSAVSTDTLSISTAAGSAGVACSLGRQVRRRSALLTTKTDEKPMAAAPIIGLSVTPQGDSAPAATGMQMAL